jgi:hypothetical protein
MASETELIRLLTPRQRDLSLVGLGEEGDLGGCNSADKRKRAHVVRAVVILT